MRILARLLAASAAFLLAGRAAALPGAGEKVPRLEAHDLNGKAVALPNLLGARRTLFVAIADRDAGPEMRRWFEAVQADAPQDVAYVSAISLELPFFVRRSYAARKAKDEVPEEHWDASLLDVDGAMAKELGLPDDEAPTAFVLDEGGKVLASFHGKVGAEGAAAIFEALGLRAPSPR